MERTHVCDLFRPAVQTGSRGEGTLSWPAAATSSAVSCNLQPRSGALRQREYGRALQATWKGFFPAGTDLQEGDGVKILAGDGPARLVVTFVAAQGADWDIEADLAVSKEDF